MICCIQNHVKTQELSTHVSSVEQKHDNHLLTRSTEALRAMMNHYQPCHREPHKHWDSHCENTTFQHSALGGSILIRYVLFRCGEQSRRKWFIFTLGALICSLNVAGCINAPVYPEHWAPLTEIKASEALPFTNSIFNEYGCGPGADAYLTGSYQNKGEIAPKKEGSTADVSLTQLIFTKSELANTDPVEYVTIRGPENRVLEISAWNQDKLIITRQIREARLWGSGMTSEVFLCHYFSDGGIGINWRGSEGLKLYKAKDGALIGKLWKDGGGFFIVPFYISNSQWYRFAPIR